MSKFDKQVWSIKCNGYIYNAIGYETRGIFRVPVADCVNNEYISCTVYEILKGYKTVGERDYIGATKLNSIEIALLKQSGYNYDDCFITKE